MQNSKIEWTDATWNPVRGCSLVSAGCTNCYAMKMAHRFSGPGLPYEGLTRMTNHGPVWNGNIKLVEDVLSLPIRTKKPTKFFVNSMSDLFHEGVPFEFIDKVYAAMALSPQHIFQILTKRPDRMLKYYQSRENGFVDGADNSWFDYIEQIHGRDGKLLPHLKEAGWGFYRCGEESEFLYEGPLPLPNVWPGTSIENQKAADERIPLLLQIPAAVRFLSIEPLLGPVDLWEPRYPLPDMGTGSAFNWGHGVNWVIVGGESGKGSRPMDEQWVRDIQQQCEAAGTAFFFKQGSSANWPAYKDFDSFPEDLKIRQFPKPSITSQSLPA